MPKISRARIIRTISDSNPVSNRGHAVRDRYCRGRHRRDAQPAQQSGLTLLH